MTESEAFGFIQKTAMGTRSRMVDVARQVLEGTLEPVGRMAEPHRCPPTRQTHRRPCHRAGAAAR